MENKVSIMFSGGLDSLIAWHYAKAQGLTPEAFYVDLGHPYAKKEIEAIKVTSVNCEIPVNFINMKDIFPLIEKRLSNQIIPGRNLLLATIGAMFNDRVWINALDGEQLGKEHDKSERFFKDSTELLSFLNEFFQPKTIIESPFATMSKTETITWALNNGLKMGDLLQTTSCYSGSARKCGKCLTCFKRWTAFYLNDITEMGFESRPLDSDYFKELCVEIPKAKIAKDFSRFTPKRIAEFYALLDKLKNENIHK